MKRLKESYAYEMDMTEDSAMDFIQKIIAKAVLSNSIKQGEYFIVSDDGLFVGDQHDFDSDVLLNAIKIDDVVDFDNASPYNDFVDLSKANKKKLLSNLSSNS